MGKYCRPERSLVIFPFFKQCNPLKINLQNFEIDKKKIQDLNLKQSYSSQLNLIKNFFANTWIGLLFLFQLWHFKNIFYSKFWNCFNIFFHTWIWSQIFFQTLDYDCYFLQFWHFKNIFYSKFWNCFNIFFHTWIWSQIFFQTLEKTQSLASFSPQGIFFKFYYLECFRKFKILNFFQLFCSISWSWFKKKI